MATTPIIFTYFNIPNTRSDPILFCLKQANIPYQDARFPRDEWPLHKPHTPFGHVPTMTIGDKVYTQNNALLIYYGKQAKLYPVDPFEALQVDEILDAIEDFIFTKISPSMRENDLEKRNKLRLEVANNTGPVYFAQFEKVLERNSEMRKEQTGFAVGKSLTIADLKIYYWMKSLRSGRLDPIPTTIVDSYPLMNQIFATVDKVVENK